MSATASKQFVENLHNFIKPYNSANISPPGRSFFEGRKSHRSICQFNFYNSHNISPKLLKSVKPYNSANPSPLDQHVFEGRRSHRSIALFTFYEFCKLFLKSVENEIPYTISHARCQKKTSLGEANLIVLYKIPFFCMLFERPRPELLPRRGSGTLTAFPSREAYSGRATPPPSNCYYYCYYHYY